MAEPSEPQLLHVFFDRSVRRWPERIAVDVPPAHGRSARTRVTYAELARQAGALGARLTSFVRGECVVAILLPRRSHLLYAAQIAVLRSGAAYVCLDSAAPDEHIGYVLRDSAAVALITDSVGRARASEFAANRILEADGTLGDPPGNATLASPSPPWIGPTSLAYVVYTSGTTGWPKGVLIEHRSIANLVCADLQTFALTPDDRVAQGSSPAYDSSIEETWLAFAAGATLIVLDDDAARLGPDLVPWLRQERVTVLCPPPTLLRMTGCLDPSAALPELRLVYAGGEALSQDLADRWALGRWLENGYGPTECTVTVVRGRVHEGRAVTIGRPIRGHRAWILGDDLEEVAAGQSGELCIGGVGLARGYLGQPELTERRFPVHPRHGRIYRTGDLVRRDGDGDLFYLGRIDSQVKLRGHRIELEAIESRLAGCRGIREAACHLQGVDGNERLVAYVVPDDAEHSPPLSDLTAALRKGLPDHMIPSRMSFLASLPTTVGGKLDRRALPDIAAPCADGGSADSPRDAVEERIADAVARCLGRNDAPVDGDFFDLGGNSVRAAELISELRGDPSTAVLAVRDVYELRTVAGLADRARSCGRRPELAGGTPAPASSRPALATLAQCAWLLSAFVTGASVWYLVLFIILPFLLRAFGLIPFLLAMPVLGFCALLLYAPFAVLIAVATKRVLIGRYVPLRAPVWGSFHVRNWIVQRLLGIAPWGLLHGTPFYATALRALGARVGRRVHFHRGVSLSQGGWDLLEIGDDVTLQQDACVGLVELDGGHITVSPVSLGAGSTLEVRAGVSGDTILEDGACLGPLSSLPRGGRIPENERWEGVPARPAGFTSEPPPLPDGERILEPGRHGMVMLLARLGLTELLSLPALILAVSCVLALDLDADTFLSWLFAPWSDLRGVGLVLGLVTLLVPLSLLWQAVVQRWMRPARVGCTSRWSLAYVRIWLRSGLVETAGNWLSGTLFWPAWLRLAGARLGKNCEVSTIIDVLPEYLTVGPESFLADGIYMGQAHVHRGTVTVAPIVLGGNTFLGNHVVVPPGTQLPGDVLLGICTVADPARMRPGTSWFGHPSFELPRRERIECGRRLTHEPGPMRYATRLFWELLRCTLPVVPLAVTLLWLHVVAVLQADLGGWELMLLAVPTATMAALSVLVALVLVAKWVLLGRVRPGQHPLWSCWCSRWDFLYVMWNSHARPLLANLEGTLLLPWYLRAMGARIGRRVVLGGGFAQVVDPDMLHLEDGATVDGMFQAHSFEDRVLKIDRVRIGSGATVRRGAVLMYGADIGERSRVAPHSVVMKRERLLPQRVYEGCPTRQQ